MTTFIWNPNASGDWSDKNDWSPLGPPTAGSDVIISTLIYQTVTYSSGTETVNSLTVGNDLFQIDGGQLTIASAASFAATALIDGGTLVVRAKGTATFSDGVTFGVAGGLAGVGATLSGAGVTATSGTTTVEDETPGYDPLSLENAAKWVNTGTVDDAGVIYVEDNNSKIDNQFGGVFDLTTDYASFYSGDGDSVFDNEGTLTKTSGSGVSKIDVKLDTTGIVSASSGTLEFDGGGSLAGTFSTSGSGVIALGEGTFTAGATKVTLGGAVEVDGGILSPGAGKMLRARSQTIASIQGVWFDRVVPLAVEFVTVNVECGHLVVIDFHAFGIGVGIDLALHFQTGVGGGGGDELHDGEIADERASAPILGYEREQAVLDLVPFARAGRQMMDGDLDAEFIGQRLQFALPESNPASVTAAAVGGDRQLLGVRITLATHDVPPTTDRIDREACRIVIDADAHPTRVFSDVVDAVGRSPTKLRDDEIVHAHFFWLVLGTIFSTRVLEIADEFLFLGVDRNRWLSRGDGRLHLFVDVAKLRVAVGMVPSLQSLAIALKAVSHIAQQTGHNVMTHTVTQVLQPGREIAQALGRPQQGIHRIAARHGIHQKLEVAKQRGILLRRPLAASAGPANTIGPRELLGLAAQFRQSPAYRAASDPRDPRDNAHPAASRRHRFGRAKPATASLIQYRTQSLVAQLYRRFVNHAPILKASILPGNPSLDINRAFRFNCS